MSDAWSEIAPPLKPDSLRLRRADAQHPLNLYRGKDARGSYVFCFQGVIADLRSISLPKFGEIEVALSKLEAESSTLWQLSLTLLDSAHADIFRALCADLMNATRDLDRGADEAGITVILARLERWQRLLKRRRERLLSLQERVGLFGELLVLRDIFIPELGPLEAVRSWRGPHREEQDFLYGHWMLEVKTQLASADRTVRISSADQLDTASGSILLCHQTLGVSLAEDDASRTLRRLVDEIGAQLGDSREAPGDLFRATLMDHGYSDREEYDTESWVLGSRIFYEIREAFPRITPAMLRPGIEGVSYHLRLEACDDFRIDEIEALQRMFAAHERH